VCNFLKAHSNDPILSSESAYPLLSVLFIDILCLSCYLGFVLMRRIITDKNERSAFFRHGHVSLGHSVSELGIFGCGLYGGGKEVVNDSAGYLLRTKSEDVDEGGVATGFSVLSAIVLTN
jgi:hypothetical protein